MTSRRLLLLPPIFAAATLLGTLAAGTASAQAATSLFGQSVPAHSQVADTQPVNLGVKIRPRADGRIVGVRFYKGETNVGPHVGYLYRADGTMLAAAGTLTLETGTGWQEVRFPAAVEVRLGETYVAAYHAPAGRYAFQSGYFRHAQVNGGLVAVSTQIEGGNGVYAYGAAGVFPRKTFTAANYWVDVLFEAVGEEDAAAPDTAITAAPAGVVASRSASFEFVSPDANARFECSLDGRSFGICQSPRPVRGLSNGPHTFRVRAVDRAENADGTPAERTWRVDAEPPKSSEFPIGVWLQQPFRAQAYKDIGINFYAGLDGWPERDADPSQRITELHAVGMKLIPEWSFAAFDWISSHPEYADLFTGYLLGDEFDMSHAFQTPAEVNREAREVKANSSLPVYANFGLSYCAYPWKSTDITDADLFQYMEGLDIVGCDYYAYTDPNPPQHGINAIWAYGYGVDQMERFAGNRSVWGFLDGARLRSERMPADRIMPIVWQLVGHGADGFTYFCHDFSTGRYVRDDSCLVEAGAPEAIQAANASVQKYADVLLSPDIDGTTVTHTGQVPVTTLTKRHGGYTYVFAIGDGTNHLPQGQTQDAKITVPGLGDGAVEVLDEGRTLPMNAGTFTDRFSPYEHHVYRIGAIS